MMYIYSFEWKGGECEWVVAPNKPEAKKAYCSMIGDSDLTECTITRLSKEEVKEGCVFDPNDPEPNPNDCDYKELYPNGHNEEEYSWGYKITERLEDIIKTYTDSDVIATTEW